MMEKTLILVKHDGVQRSLVGEVIKRFEQRGLKISGLKMVHATEKQAEDHYQLTDEWVKNLGEKSRAAAQKEGREVKETDLEIAKRVQSHLIKYLSEGPIVAIIFEGYHAVKIGRKLVGDTQALTAQPGTIRGDFCIESYALADANNRPLKNIVHASGAVEEANHEISVWFSEEEIYDYEKKDWQIIH